jgi:hypothetical protein
MLHLTKTQDSPDKRPDVDMLLISTCVECGSSTEYWIERAWYVCVAPAGVVWCGPLAYGEATEEDNQGHGHGSSAWSYVR